MSSLANEIYPKLPTPIRSAAASARGLQLRLTRYGPDLDRRVNEALERDRWTDGDWAQATAHALTNILEAASTAPYYSTSPYLSELAAFSGLPVTPKSEVRKSPQAFWAEVPKNEKLVNEATSGTSGTPLALRFTRESTREWFALLEARMRRWHGLKVSDRWAMFGGQVVVPVSRTAAPFWVHNVPMHQLYVSTHHISRRNAAPMAEALTRFRPRYILGYPSSMALLARFCLEDNFKLPSVDVVLSNAETLTPSQREVISAAFNAPVRNTYGMAEAVAGASECPYGSMHMWPEVGIVEVLNENGSVSSEIGDSGPLLLTGLLNKAMPLLRYEVGDIGSVPTASACRCGRTLPILGEIQGRSTDFVVTPDGRHVFWLNPVLRDIPLSEAQIVQHSIHDLEVRLVPTGSWSETNSNELVSRLEDRVGDRMGIQISVVDEIKRDPSGKFRPVVSHVTVD